MGTAKGIPEIMILASHRHHQDDQDHIKVPPEVSVLTEVTAGVTVPPGVKPCQEAMPEAVVPQELIVYLEVAAPLRHDPLVQIESTTMPLYRKETGR